MLVFVDKDSILLPNSFFKNGTKEDAFLITVHEGEIFFSIFQIQDWFFSKWENKQKMINLHSEAVGYLVV